MDHADHVNLIRDGIHPSTGVWADFGSGRGAFTLALAELLEPGATIHSIDRDPGALRAQERAFNQHFPRVHLHLHEADFNQADFNHNLELPVLDGIVMANALHFQLDPQGVLRRLRQKLKPEGRLVIVEYNITKSSYAVPYPVPYTRFRELAERAGYIATRLLATRPSSSLHEIYSARSTNSPIQLTNLDC